jgi:AbiV family abortive infection protein
VQARALKRVAQLPKPARLEVIAEGLGLLAEHVSKLRDDVHQLAEAQRPRGFAALAAQADEEAAKALILLDVVRMGWRDQDLVQRQVRRFYDHLARRIYAEVAEMRPATFGEVRELVDSMRPALYLDGPNDFDWIFRNQLLARREEQLYVDYVHDEDGDRWVTPAAYADIRFGYSTPVLDLVVAASNVGLCSRHGLEVAATVWKGVAFDDSTHWVEVEARNREVLEQLEGRGLMLPQATPEDAWRVVDRWTFPLGALELEEMPVTLQELQAERERRLANLRLG